MKVDFFVAGAQKCGTTALDSFLRQHPAIQMATVKEVHFFDSETIDWSAPSLKALHKAFDWSEEKRVLRGEATPIYTYWPQSIERIKNYNADARLIVLLRHPIFRAFSHWRMAVAGGQETLTFAEAVSYPARERVAQAPGGVHRFFSYVERGFYAPQIERLLSLFPKSQLLFLRTDQLWMRHIETLERVFEFLGVSRHSGIKRKFVLPADRDVFRSSFEAGQAQLAHMFARDLVTTSELSRLDLSDWLQSDYGEPDDMV